MILRAETTEETGVDGPGGVIEFPRPALRVAREILSFIPDEVELTEHDAGSEIWYALRSESPNVRLRRIILKASSLMKLDSEKHRDIKLGYLKRELARALPRAGSWSYPRMHAPERS